MKDTITGKEIKGVCGIEEYKKKRPDKFKMDVELGMEWTEKL